jgi:hypothetical protein
MIPQVFLMPLPFFFFSYFRSLFCDFHDGILEALLCGFLLGVTYENLVPLCLVTLPQNPLEMASIWWFSVEFLERWFWRLTFDSS